MPLVQVVREATPRSHWLIVLGVGWDAEVPWRPWLQIVTGLTGRWKVPTVNVAWCGLYVCVAWYAVPEVSR